MKKLGRLIVVALFILGIVVAWTRLAALNVPVIDVAQTGFYVVAGIAAMFAVFLGVGRLFKWIVPDEDE